MLIFHRIYLLEIELKIELNIIIDQGPAIHQWLARCLIRWNSFLVLDLGLDSINGSSPPPS